MPQPQNVELKNVLKLGCYKHKGTPSTSHIPRPIPNLSPSPSPSPRPCRRSNRSSSSWRKAKRIKIYDLDSEVYALGAIVATTYRQYINIFKYLRILKQIVKNFLYLTRRFFITALMCAEDLLRRPSTGQIRTHLGHVHTL